MNSQLTNKLKAYIKRWFHGLANFSHRDVTFWSNHEGKEITSVIACDCGKIFWKHPKLLQDCLDKYIAEYINSLFYPKRWKKN